MIKKILKVFLLIASVSCTSAKNEIDGRIVGGFPINITDAPWQVSLQYYGNHFCGGSIISSKWILTAAHCRMPIEEVRIGSSTVKGGEVFSVKQSIPHPNFNLRTDDYDYLLIELTEEIKFDETKQAIRLADKNEHFADKSLVFVSGWGSTQNDDDSNIQLRGVEVPIVNHRICFASYLYYLRKITPRMICAGLWNKGGKDSCKGDSGGPMVAYKDKKPTLAGVVSFGAGCAIRFFPGVYSNVAEVRDWISSQTGI